MKFTILNTDQDTKARAGVLETAHGKIETPIFMPVGTRGTVKGVHQEELKSVVNAHIILGNTYHLYLRPGMEVLEAAGGLHKFMNWDGPILTDSGGYQVYSLAKMRKIKEDGVHFSSHIDGSKLFFTPEYAMDIQRIIGADIIMAFDECPPYPCDYKYAKNSMHRTHRWLKRCCDRVDSTEPKYGFEQTLAPIVQGSVFKDLRKQSAEYITSMDREINAIGGLSVGEPSDEMYETTEIVCDILPKEKPRYLMGVGTPANLLENIALGVDMFDCVLPTRNARHGQVYTSEGIMNMKNKKWELDFSPLDANLDCPTSNNHSKSYVRHLFHVQELLAVQIASIHNLAFYLWLVKEARKHIIANTFMEWKKEMIPKISRKI